jgi:hypothetical protein
MNESKLVSRRQMLRKTAMLSMAAMGVAAVGTACKSAPKDLQCNDTLGLAPVDIETRKALEYVDRTVDPKKDCTGCLQYVAAADDAHCGTCKMFKGSVNPKGYCKVWQSKTAAPPA